MKKEAFFKLYVLSAISLLMFLLPTSFCRHVDTASSSDSSSRPFLDFPEGHGRTERAIPDPSCKGRYDHNLFADLDRVCEDCFNLYRKPKIAIDCRKDCFSDRRFIYCVQDLELDVEKFKKWAESLRLTHV